MLRASLPRELVMGTLAMPWRSSLARDRQFLALRGQEHLGKLTGKRLLLFLQRSAVVLNIKPLLRASLPREPGEGRGPGSDLQVFSSTYQADLCSFRTGTTRKADSEKFFSLGKKLVAESTL